MKIIDGKRFKAAVCHHCPLCRHARKKPDSFIGRIIHQRHAEDCPSWQAEQDLYGKE